MIIKDDGLIDGYGSITIKVSATFLTLEYYRVDLEIWQRKRTVVYKEVLKLNRYYNTDYHGAYITPFWYEKLTELNIIK